MLQVGMEPVDADRSKVNLTDENRFVGALNKVNSTPIIFTDSSIQCFDSNSFKVFNASSLKHPKHNLVKSE